MNPSDIPSLAAARSGQRPVLTPQKMASIYVVLCMIFFVTGTYVGVDWASYFYPFPNKFSPLAGYMRTILCIILAMMIREHSLEGATATWHRDGTLLISAFFLAGVADVFLILLGWMTPGTVIFLVVHSLLIVRHSNQLGTWLRGRRPGADVRWLAGTGATIAGGTALFFLRVRSLIEPTGQLGLFSFYLIVLSISLWTAFSTRVNPFFPRPNALQIIFGMICFFFCDITVGLAFVLKGTREGLILSNLTAFSYTPALTLLALSGYRWPGTIIGIIPCPEQALVGEEPGAPSVVEPVAPQALPSKPGE